MNTLHSYERAKERAGMNKAQAVRFTNLAYERGKTADMMPRREREYMEKKESVAGCRTIYYNDYFFIFSPDGICITLYESPAWFCKKNHYDGKEKIRDVKKYMRYNVAMEVA